MNKETFIDLMHGLESLSHLELAFEAFVNLYMDDDSEPCLYSSRAYSTLEKAIIKGVARTLDYADYQYFKDLIEDYMFYKQVTIIENDQEKILDTPEQLADYIYG